MSENYRFAPKKRAREGDSERKAGGQEEEVTFSLTRDVGDQKGEEEEEEEVRVSHSSIVFDVDISPALEDEKDVSDRERVCVCLHASSLHRISVSFL